MAIAFLYPTSNTLNGNAASGTYLNIDEGVAAADGSVLTSLEKQWSTTTMTFGLADLPGGADSINSIKLRVRARINGTRVDDNVTYTFSTNIGSSSVAWVFSTLGDTLALANKEVTLVGGTQTVANVNAAIVTVTQTYNASMSKEIITLAIDAIELEVDYALGATEYTYSGAGQLSLSGSSLLAKGAALIGAGLLAFSGVSPTENLNLNINEYTGASTLQLSGVSQTEYVNVNSPNLDAEIPPHGKVLDDATGLVAVPYSWTPTNSGGAATSYALVSGVLPYGTTLNTSTGEISGNPTYDTAYGQAFTFTLSATNASGTASETYSIKVRSKPWYDGTMPDGEVGVPYSYTITAKIPQYPTTALHGGNIDNFGWSQWMRDNQNLVFGTTGVDLDGTLNGTVDAVVTNLNMALHAYRDDDATAVGDGFIRLIITPSEFDGTLPFTTTDGYTGAGTLQLSGASPTEYTVGANESVYTGTGTLQLSGASPTEALYDYSYNGSGTLQFSGIGQSGELDVEYYTGQGTLQFSGASSTEVTNLSDNSYIGSGSLVFTGIGQSGELDVEYYTGLGTLQLSGASPTEVNAGATEHLYTGLGTLQLSGSATVQFVNNTYIGQGNLTLSSSADSYIEAGTVIKYVGSGPCSIKNSNSGTQFNVDYPSVLSGNYGSIQVNDIILLQVSSKAGGANTPSQGDFGGTLIGTEDRVAVINSVYWKRALGGETGTAATILNQEDYSISKISVLRGCRIAGNPFEVSGTNGAPADSAVQITGVTTTSAQNLIVGFYSGDDGSPLIENWANVNFPIQEAYYCSTEFNSDGKIVAVFGHQEVAGPTGDITADNILWYAPYDPALEVEANVIAAFIPQNLVYYNLGGGTLQLSGASPTEFNAGAAEYLYTGLGTLQFSGIGQSGELDVEYYTGLGTLQLSGISPTEVTNLLFEEYTGSSLVQTTFPTFVVKGGSPTVATEVTYPAGILEDDIILLHIESGDATTAETFAGQGNFGGALLSNANSPGFSISQNTINTVYWKRALGTESGQVVTGINGYDHQAGIMSVWRDASDDAYPFDSVASSGVAGSVNFSFPSLTTKSDYCLIILSGSIGDGVRQFKGLTSYGFPLYLSQWEAPLLDSGITTEVPVNSGHTTGNKGSSAFGYGQQTSAGSTGNVIGTHHLSGTDYSEYNALNTIALKAKDVFVDNLAFSGASPTSVISDYDYTGQGTLQFSGASPTEVTNFLFEEYIGAGTLQFSGIGQSGELDVEYYTGLGTLLFSGVSDTSAISDYDYTGAGTLQFSGASPTEYTAGTTESLYTGAGTLQFSGTSPTSAISDYDYTGVGTLQLSGASPTEITNFLFEEYTGAGTLQFSGIGQSGELDVEYYTGQGTLQFSGASSTEIVNLLFEEYIGVGTLQFGGTSPTSAISDYDYSGLGTLQLSGVSPTEITNLLFEEYTGAGTLQFSGIGQSGELDVEYYTGAGTLQLSGASATEVTNYLFEEYTGVGTLQFSGASPTANNADNTYIGVGTLQFSGASPTEVTNLLFEEYVGTGQITFSGIGQSGELDVEYYTGAGTLQFSGASPTSATGEYVYTGTGLLQFSGIGQSGELDVEYYTGAGTLQFSGASATEYTGELVYGDIFNASTYFPTGSSVTIELFDPITGNVITLADNICVEINNTGMYVWDTTKLQTQPVSYQEYVWKMTDGVTANGGMIRMCNNETDSQRLLDIYTLLGLNDIDPVDITPAGAITDSGNIDIAFSGDGVALTRMVRQP